MKINAAMSDLFFNYQHDRAWVPSEVDRDSSYYDEAIMRDIADEFIFLLDSLGVATPTKDELVTNFFERL